MTHQDIAHRRLHNQFISQSTFEKPSEVVEWLGAVQAQDYAAAKWAISLRSQGLTSAAIEEAFADGAILRTHVMRPTWHFVTPSDIRWLLALTAPRVIAASAYYFRQQELDDALFKRSNSVLAKALQGGQQLTRTELMSVLRQAGIVSEDALRFTYIVMRAELDGIICSGARRGKQFTYALLDERVPPCKTIERDEALAEFARRYFTSHGPATLPDFVWWSGLTAADARAGLEMIATQFMHESVDGQMYWFSTSTPPIRERSQAAYLLSSFDEYTVSYKDRRAVVDTSGTQKLNPPSNILLSYIMLLDGWFVGTWKRTLKKDTVTITLSPSMPLNKDVKGAFVTAAERYGAFLAMPVNVSFQME